MVTIPLQALVLALSFAVPAAVPPRTPNVPEPEKMIVVDDDVFTVDRDDPVVVHVNGGARGYIGVRLIPITPELRTHMGAPKDAGVLVGQIEPDGAEAKAGLQVGDLITAVDGDRVESAGDVARAVRRKKAGETVKLDVFRDRAAKHLTVTVQERKKREFDLRDFRHGLRDGILRDFEFRGPLIGRDRGRLESRLEDLEKRLNDLERKLAR